MTTNEIRQKYLAFMKQKGHAIIPRSNLVPQDDPTTLFTGSGMQPLIPYLLGQKHPAGVRLADSQPSFRAQDIDEVGNNRHTTFFEMLGNWSLGDYFKREQLAQFWQFITDEVGLDPKRIYASVFIGDKENNIPKDTESAEIWQELFKSKGLKAQAVELGSAADGSKKGMQGGRIFYYDAKENWWSRAGAPQHMPAGEPGGPDSEVFYEFPSVVHDSAYGEHCHPACDCGHFIEIGNSVFMQYIKNDKGGFDELPQKNVDYGGGLERIAAAAIDSPDVYKISLMWPIIEKLQDLSGKKYDSHTNAMRVIADHMRGAVFLAVDGVVPSNKEQGYVARRLVRRAIMRAFDLGIEQNFMQEVVPVVADLYHDAYPEVDKNREQVIDVLVKEEKAFRQTLRKGLSELQKYINKNEIKNADGLVVVPGEVVFTLYDTFGYPVELTQEIIAMMEVATLDDNWHVEFQKRMNEQRERSQTAAKGTFKGGLADQSEQTTRHHTATHLMYEALRRVLGGHVVQRGSNVTGERIRFDFSHDEKMTDEQKSEVERIVNEQIQKGLIVTVGEHPTEEAFKIGAKGAFGDKYGDRVKVYTMGMPGEEPFSIEICGGPHVETTSGLGIFKILKEESSSAGVRRIKAKLT